MRTAALSTLSALFLVTLSAHALADEAAPADKPQPPLPADKPQAPAPGPLPADAAKPRPSGVTFDMGVGLGVVGGQIVDRLDFTSVESTFALKLGVYVTEHVAISAAFRGGYGSMDNGLDKAYSLSLPLRVEYAFTDRFRGVYVEGGLSPLNKLGAYTDTSKGKDPATLDASSSLDYGLGVGYRIPIAYASLDLHLGLDWGRYDEASVHTVDGDAGGTIDPSYQATHWALGLGLAYRWGTR